jgi:glutaredoxin 3
MVTVYSKNNCPYCTQAKNLLKSRGVAFEEINIEERPEAREFILAEGHRTMPQIYQDGKILVAGGYMGLAKQLPEFFETLKEAA